MTQIEIIKKAIDLENEVFEETLNLNNVENESFKRPPTAPQCRQVQRTYPEIFAPKAKINWPLLVIPSVFLLIVPPLLLIWIGGYLWYHNSNAAKQREAYIEHIRNAPWYIQQCAELDVQYDAQQEVYNQEYNTAKDIYDNQTMVEYNNEKALWDEEHNAKVDEVSQKLTSAETALNNLYEETKIVPIQYREIDILEYIYEVMSSSDYDVKTAIDIYDRNRQLELDSARLHEQRVANQHAAHQNYLLNEQNAIAEQARRDANRAAIVSAVQHHNTNKALKKLNR